MRIQGYAALAPKRRLELFEYDEPRLSSHEVLVKVSHCGLCHTDLHMIDDAWGKSSYPLVPGHEIVGTIVNKGALVELPVGTRVGLGWVRSSCLECAECLQGNTNICPHKKRVVEKGHFGGFADHVVGDARFVLPIPEELDSAHAAPLLCAGATVFAPLSRQASPTASVGIIGIGGLGHLALLFARAFGYETSAISSSPSKEQDAKRLGAHHFYTWDKNRPPPLRFDSLLCTSDAALDWKFVLTLLRPNGTLYFLSRPKKFLLDPFWVVSTQRSVSGSNNANRFLMKEMLTFAAREKIQPQIELMPLSRVNDGIEKLRANQVRYRIVLQV